MLGLLGSGCSVIAPNGKQAVRTSGGSFTPLSGAPSDGPGQAALARDAVEPVPRRLPLSKYGNPQVYEVAGKYYRTMESAKGYRERGNASWYGAKFHGRLTSSREVYDMYQYTAAHRSLPIPTFVRVTNLENHKSIIVKVNDRGPFHDDRILDLSYAAALKLDVVKHGTAPVEVVAIEPDAEPQIQLVKNASATAAAVAPAEGLSTEPEAVRIRGAKISSPEQSAEGGIYLQLGAYSQVANAENMRRLVRDIIPAANVDILSTEFNAMHRVQLGPLFSNSLVTEVLLDLNRGGVTNYHIIRVE
ncbi:unnamed protein product [Cyprideis torosa]|uniref:Uncharacterized protein n=1 Tax=Cyprideis torosa TaxID=163714 RepID=A0A7R8W3M7_9CRUS|nr:unnamed protein product [Cyprideis torosa]CAG0878734.1 unnamed protein product [Cyprideis torosa]